MKTWQKWLLAIPFILAFSLGLPALAAGKLWWFADDWSNEAFVLIIAGMWTGATYIVHPERQKRGPSLARALISVGLLTVILVAVFDRTHGPAATRPVTWSVLGLMLCLLATLVGAIALRALGRFYTYEPEILPDQKLVTDGVYHYVRHPIYSALLLWMLGFPLVIRSLWGVAAGVLLIGPGLWLRIREEESMLLRVFGDDYRAYQAWTRRVIPFIF